MSDTKASFGERLKQFFQLEPVVVRGILVAVAAVVVQFGVPDVNQWVDVIVDLFSALSALYLVLVARPAVTSMAKVIAFQPKPFAEPDEIAPGDAVVVTPEQLTDVEIAATQDSQGRRAA